MADRAIDLEGLRRADFVAVSSSGGIDSAAALLVAVDSCRAAGVSLDRVVVIHADMGRMEWPSAESLGQVAADGFDARHSTDLARAQAESLGLRFEVCRRNQGDLLEQMGEKGTHSRVGATNCQGTSDHKRGPIWTVYTALAKEFRAATGETRPCRIVEVVGLAAHESDARATTIAKGNRCQDLPGSWTENVRASNGRREVTTWWPLAHVTKNEPWETVRAATLYGFPEPSWVYGAGLPRLSCSFCVFAPRDALNRAAQLHPTLFAEYVEVEKSFARPWNSRFTLADVADDLAAGRVVDAAEGWGNQA